MRARERETKREIARERMNGKEENERGSVRKIRKRERKSRWRARERGDRK